METRPRPSLPQGSRLPSVVFTVDGTGFRNTGKKYLHDSEIYELIIYLGVDWLRQCYDLISTLVPKFARREQGPEEQFNQTMRFSRGTARGEKAVELYLQNFLRCNVKYS